MEKVINIGNCAMPIMCLLIVCSILSQTRPVGGESAFFQRSGENIVVNGGFELEKDGIPVGWSAPHGIASLDPANAHSGKFGLKYARTDRNDYRLVTQQIPCIPGKIYEASVWVKGENIKDGDQWDQGAGFCIEWSDENGKWLGGVYPPCIVGTFDWQKISTIVRIPKEARRVSIVLYLRRRNTGTAWFDDVEVVQVAPPLASIQMISPAYRGLLLTPTKGKKISAKISINREEHGLVGKPLEIISELTDAKGNSLSKGVKVLQGDEEETILQLALPELKPNEYQYVCHIRIGKKELGKLEERINVVRQVEAKVYVDERQRLIVDGKPFFPIGLYLGPTEEEHLARISEAGFNTILCYGYGVGRDPEAYMERAKKYGLKVIYSVKDFYEGTRYFPKVGKSGLELARDYVMKLRDHPALLAWYINDELPITFIPRLTEMYELIKSLDPNHPQFQVLYQIPDLELYYNCTDIMGVDPYPIPSRPIDMVSDWTSSAIKAMNNAKPVWVVPQIFDWSVYRGGEPREPTFQEKKNMFYQALIHGAKGLIAYSYFDLFKTTGRKEAPKELFEKRWKEVCEIVAEINKLVPALLEGEDVPKLQGVLEKGKVHVRGITYRNKLYILLANTSSDSLHLTLPLPDRGWKSASRLDGREEKVKNGQLVLQLQPLEATTCVLSK
jgi:hypothetical protein